MSETTDMRAWAVREGLIDEGGRGPLPAVVRTAWENRVPHEPDYYADDPDDEPVTVAVPSLPGPGPETEQGAGEPATPRRPEVKPQGRKVSAAERFRKRVAAAPKTKHKRVSIEDVASGLWGLAGLAFGQNLPTAPVGRVLAVQAPAAGIIVEEQFRGTIVDKVLQPIARGAEQGKIAAALLGPPVIVAAITARPEILPVARPILKAIMLSYIEIAGPAMKKAQDRVQKQAEAYAEQFGEIDLDAIIDSFWSTEGLPVAESADEEAAVRRARGDG